MEHFQRQLAKRLPETPSGGFRADGTRRTVPSRSHKRHVARRANRAAKQARKANR